MFPEFSLKKYCSQYHNQKPDEAVLLKNVSSPITPQTIIVERLADYVEDGSLKSQYIHVESEHSAIMAALGSCAAGSRTFTATSSQGLLYMAEGLPFVSGSRFPLVMVNANRATAVPWSRYNDHNDSMMFLNSGWIQLHVEDAQEALDMVLQAYKLAEDPEIMTPVMINVDGFIVTHTYELVQIPKQEDADNFLPAYNTDNKMSLEDPKSVCIGIGPEFHTEVRYKQHKDLDKVEDKLIEIDREYGEKIGRTYGGMTECYQCDDAEAILVTVGSISGAARMAADRMRAKGKRVGVMKLRVLRPFPIKSFEQLPDSVKCLGVLDKNLSYGYEGTVYTDTNSALYRTKKYMPTMNFIAGLGGRDISVEDIEEMFDDLLNYDSAKEQDEIKFVNLNLKGGRYES